MYLFIFTNKKPKYQKISWPSRNDPPGVAGGLLKTYSNHYSIFELLLL